jgi:hypothetical protein
LGRLFRLLLVIISLFLLGMLISLLSVSITRTVVITRSLIGPKIPSARNGDTGCTNDPVVKEVVNGGPMD